MRVLVVDDEPAVRLSLERAMRLEEYEVESVPSGTAALERLVAGGIDLVILDVAMPGLDGFATCRALRARGDRVPVLILSARTRLTERVLGLDSGADDYLGKPFELDELYARIRALLRRGTSADVPQKLVLDNLVIDSVGHLVWRGENVVVLTPIEFSLLELLVSRAGEVLRRDWIFERVWGYPMDANSNSLEVFVANLRRKTEEHGDVRLLHTVRGVGYVARVETSDATSKRSS